jgi:hypothetical protein
MERPELPEVLLWLAPGLIAMAARVRAMRNRRIHGAIGIIQDSL